MYIGKHRTPQKEWEAEDMRRHIHIPENYAGNAFPPEGEEKVSDEEMREESPPFDERGKHLPMCIEAPKEGKGFFPRLDRLFSSDTLLILLAILLSGSEDGGELAVILLLLLLF